MGGGGELAHVRADLGQDDFGGALVDPGDSVQQRHLLSEGGDDLLDPRRERGDGLVQVVDVGQDLSDQQPVMVGAEPAGQRLPQRRQLAAEPALGQRSQHLRVVGAGDQGFQHRPAGDADDVGGHAGELDPGVLEDLVQSLHLPGALLDLGLAVAGQLAQLPDRAGRHEAGADQTMLDQLGDPGRVGHIGLPPRDVVQVGRVQQPALHLALEQLPDRLPVAPGRLHPHPGYPEAGQPLGQQPQPGGRCGEPAGLDLAPAVAVRHPHTGGHRVLVHVQTGAAFDQRLHLLASSTSAIGSLPSGGASTRGI